MRPMPIRTRIFVGDRTITDKVPAISIVEHNRCCRNQLSIVQIFSEFTQAFGARSVCDRSMPVSMTATTLPVIAACRQNPSARVAEMSAPGLPIRNLRAYSSKTILVKSESLGIVEGYKR